MSIRLENVNYKYSAGTVYEKHALKNINLEIHKGEFVGIAGHTGSGKSTLIQHLNGLEKATSGAIYYNEQNIYDKNFDLDGLRMKVGLSFQYPEYQLFEATVLEDVCFGPKNQRLSKEEVLKRGKEALSLVGMTEEVYDKSPFQLSGGQKRRVAIAGILAMNPEYLILDEPAAGLDPKGRKEILNLLKELHQKKQMGIVLVSHSMEDLSNYVNRVIVMNHGEKIFDDIPSKVFSHVKELEEMGLSAPQLTYLLHTLYEKGFAVSTDILDEKEAILQIVRARKEKERERLC